MQHNPQISIKEWTRINAPLGIELGYPLCCVNEFCQQPPFVLNNQKPSKTDQKRYKAACINGQYSGFIPCAFHASQINAGKMNLSDLVKNRSDEFPEFPHA
jgi:hypothetical protein